MAIITFKQGEDKILSGSIVETPAIDFSLATAIKAIFKIGGVEQKKYSLAPDATYGTLEVDGTNKNQINFFVERIDSSLFSKGLINVSLVASFNSTNNWIINNVNENKLTYGFKQNATFTSPVSYTLIPGMTYTTPDDGKNRRWDIRFKSMGVNDGGVVTSAKARLYNVTTAQTYDLTQIEYNGTSPISASLYGSVVLTSLEDIEPNQEIVVQVEKVGSGASANFYYNKLILLERRK